MYICARKCVLVDVLDTSYMQVYISGLLVNKGGNVQVLMTVR